MEVVGQKRPPFWFIGSGVFCRETTVRYHGEGVQRSVMIFEEDRCDSDLKKTSCLAASKAAKQTTHPLPSLYFQQSILL